MNEIEKDLFVQLCCFVKPNKEKVQDLLEQGGASPELLGMLFANRVAGVAYHVLKETDSLGSVDREFRNSLRHAYLYNQKTNEDYMKCVAYLSEELEKCDVPYALLKGAYLCLWYPSGCRTSNDVDVLVSQEDVTALSMHLRSLCFVQGFVKNDTFIPAARYQIIESKMMRGETVPFIREMRMPFIKYLEVDLNFSLDYKNGDEDMVRKLLSKNEQVNVGGTLMRTLDRADFLLHLCAHLYKEATTMPWIRMKRDMTFYKYCDIYALLQSPNEEQADELIRRAKELQLTRELAYCLLGIQAFWGLSNETLEGYLRSRGNGDLDEVVDPSEKRKYGYAVTNPRERFFGRDRVKLLQEV